MKILYVVHSLEWLETVARLCADLCLSSRLQSSHRLCTGTLDHLQNRNFCALLFHRTRRVSFQVNQSWTNTFPNVFSRGLAVFTLCVCSHWHFRDVWSRFAFKAVAVYSPPSVLMLWIPNLDMLALYACVCCECVCVWVNITLYANAASVQSNSLKYNNTIVPNRVETWMSLNWFSKLSETARVWNGTLVMPPSRQLIWRVGLL